MVFLLGGDSICRIAVCSETVVIEGRVEVKVVMLPADLASVHATQVCVLVDINQRSV